MAEKENPALNKVSDVEDKKGNVDKQISSVLTKKTLAKVSMAYFGLAILAGIGGMLVGALVWFLIAVIFKVEIGYAAILVGLCVGFAMRFILKSTNSFSMGIVAGTLALIGILLGNFLIYYFAFPGWQREFAEQDFGKEAASILTDDFIRANYTYTDYLKDEFTATENNNPFISYLFVILAVTFAFSRVFDIRSPHKTL